MARQRRKPRRSSVAPESTPLGSGLTLPHRQMSTTWPPRRSAGGGGGWGRIDILAANAGIYPHIPLADIGVADWNRVMAINVTGAMLAIQACLPPMSERGYGRIVLTSSITGSVVGQPGYTHYGAS